MISLNILVTGGAGYIGSHIVQSLLQANNRVIVLDNLSKGHREAVPVDVFIEGDLADRGLLDRIFREEVVDGVIHLAADSLVAESMAKPGRYYYNNICNGLNLLEAMVEHQVKYLVFSSTAAVYGEPEVIPIPEEHPTIPTNPYGESKLFFEKILARYQQIHHLQYISLRYFNAAGADPAGQIGEAHHPETHLIPLVLKQALGSSDKFYLFGDDYPTEDGSCIRDYIHVNDLAQAHLLALHSLTAGMDSAIYNLGNGQGYSVKEVLQVAGEVTGKLIETEIRPRRAGDPAVLVASSKKIKEQLGWQPCVIDLKEIIETAWQWHRKGGFNGTEQK